MAKVLNETFEIKTKQKKTWPVVLDKDARGMDIHVKVNKLPSELFPEGVYARSRDGKKVVRELLAKDVLFNALVKKKGNYIVEVENTSDDTVTGLIEVDVIE